MRFPFHPYAAGRLAASILAVVGLAACSASGGGGLLSGGSATGKKQYSMQDFAKSSYCPPIEIRGGTEAMTIYDSGHDNEPAYVRQQASITRTARECQMAGNTLSIKVGIAGRVIAGPKGGAGTVTLPLRVAITKQVGGSGPLYSNLFKVPVTVSAPDYSADYEQVFPVSLDIAPADRNLIIYVGFDQGK
jgi:hypothetical protein